MSIRIIEKHINNPPPEGYKNMYFREESPDYIECLRRLAKGEFDVFIEYYLDDMLNETAYIQLVSKKTGEIQRIVGNGLSQGSIDFDLRKMGHRTFHSHYAKNGNIYHDEGGSYVCRGKWKVIHEKPNKNQVEIRSGNGNGNLKITHIDRDYGEVDKQPEVLTIYNRSFKYH